VVRTKDGQEKDTVVKIGVNVEWDFVTPTPTPTTTPTPTPAATPTPIATPL
jgi:hypothetical protein